MSNEQVTVTAQEEDKTQTIPFAIYAGEDEDVVFVGEYNADQMARVIDQTFTRYYSIDEYEVYDDPSLIFDTKDEDLTPAEFFKRMGVTPNLEDLEQLAEEAAKASAFWSENVEPYVPDVARNFLKLIQDEKDHQKFREFASAYIAENMPDKIIEFYTLLVAEVMDHSLRMLAIHKKEKGGLYPSAKDLDKLADIVKENLSKRLGAQGEGRPPAFRSRHEFLLVLDRSLLKISGELTRRKLWSKITKDPLCQLSHKNKPTQDDVKTLDKWLAKVEKTWPDVQVRYTDLRNRKNSSS